MKKIFRDIYSFIYNIYEYRLNEYINIKINIFIERIYRHICVYLGIHLSDAHIFYARPCSSHRGIQQRQDEDICVPWGVQAVEGRY